MIYFAQRASDRLIKIGKSEDVAARMSSLSKKMGCEVVLLAKREGGFAEEKHVHKLLSEFRVEGEWFLPNSHVLAFIANVHDFAFPDMSGRGTRLTTVITDELNEALKALAKADARTLDKYVSRLLEAHVKRATK